jgi:hypothetical protein
MEVLWSRITTGFTVCIGPSWRSETRVHKSAAGLRFVY